MDDQKWVRFCGFELKWADENRLQVAQPSYTRDLLQRHGVKNKKAVPMSKIEVPEALEETVTAEEIRAAQALTGELLWLAVRSRPDISFAVAQIGRQVSKRPRWAVQVGQGILEYLAGTPDLGLMYEGRQGDRGPEGNLPIPRHEKLIESFSDISFTPQGERSLQGILTCVGGAPLLWEATRQAFATLSTAESELVGYVEAMVMIQSVEALLQVIYGSQQFEKVLYGDNTSAISILQQPDGPWRTRHLRLRSNCLKEKLRSEKGDWKIRHLKGTELIADYLTKPIVAKGAWERFWNFLGTHKSRCDPVAEDEPLRNTEVGDREPENQDFLPDVVAGAELEWRETETADELKVKAATVVSSLKKWVNVPIVGEVTEKVKAFVAVVFTLVVISLVVRLKRLENPDWPGLDQQSLDELSSILEALGTLEEMINEEKQTRAIGRQDFQEVREDEPTLRKVEVVPRENEPGSTQGLTPENPEGTKVLGRETPKSFGLGTQKGWGNSKPSFDAFGNSVASTERGGAAEPCSEALLFVVSGSNHCPEGCPGSFRACALRLRDAMASTASGGAGGDEPDEGWPDKSWVKGAYEPEPSKKKKKKGKGHRNEDEEEPAEDQLEPLKKAKREEPTPVAAPAEAHSEPSADPDDDWGKWRAGGKDKEPTEPTEAPEAAPGTPVVILGEAVPTTPPLYPLVDAAEHGSFRPPEPKNPPRTSSTTSSMATDAGPATAAGPATDDGPSSSRSSMNLPGHLVSYSVRGFGRRTVEWGYYTPEGEPMVIVPSSPDRSEELEERTGDPAGSTEEPEEEVPPEDPSEKEQPEDRSDKDREKKEKKKKKEEEIERLPVIERGPRDPPPDPPAPALKLAALRMPCSIGRDEGHGRRQQEEESQADEENPWERAEFQQPPSGKKDGWAPQLKGWVMRKHGTLRERRFHPLHRGVPFDPNCLEALRVTVAFGQDGRRTIHRDRWSDGPRDLFPTKESWRGFTFFKLKNLEGNQDGIGQVPRYHAGEDGPLPYVPTQEPFGPTTTSSSTSNAAAEPSSSTSNAAAEPSSSTAAAAASGAALRWGYRRGDAAERGRVVVQAGSQTPQPPANVEETSGEWSVIEEV